MKFNKNKKAPIHQWYPFVEGYSREFIRGIVEELPYEPKHCLDPFAGSGTTPVELQYLGVKCSSFEVNPFLYNLSVTKMRTDYTLKGVFKNYDLILKSLNSSLQDLKCKIDIPKYKSIVEREGIKKWIFNSSTMDGLLDIKYAISLIPRGKYRNLFKIAFASILLQVSNVYRNGKCLSYRDRKRTSCKEYSRSEVHQMFNEIIQNIVLPDITLLEKVKRTHDKIYTNYKYCKLGDFRRNILKINNNMIDLVITSPPYLNSRDYTDIYMVELWMLDYINSYEELRALREKTFRSHVQINWGQLELLQINELEESIQQLNNFKSSFWNKGLLDMIKGYFLDMEILFSNLSLKMKSGGKIYFNIANSAYYGVEIKVDQIISRIAENNGFTIDEIRKARFIKPSVQQKKTIEHLLEVVIVMTKTI